MKKRRMHEGDDSTPEGGKRVMYSKKKRREKYMTKSRGMRE